MYDCGDIFTREMIKEFKKDIISVIEEHYNVDLNNLNLQFSYTKQDFKGDFTLVIFPLLKMSKKNLQETGEIIGELICSKIELVKSWNLVNGFLNFSLEDSFWINNFKKIIDENNYGHVDRKDKKLYVVEFSSPNTNKPLHLGHIRNNILGDSISRIIEANGHKSCKVQIINDRGIHICKSMLAWMNFGNGETPESSGMKGDHLVGKYYVKFENEYRQEVSKLINSRRQVFLLNI